ncbi:hypothetical protein M0R19_05850 [Candidatus Pacearchaeota archaeon]|jgi:hypothetical protein|nr:hypothetical protein [Candidatus Pacearchaeota archaeon]
MVGEYRCWIKDIYIEAIDGINKLAIEKEDKYGVLVSYANPIHTLLFDYYDIKFFYNKVWLLSSPFFNCNKPSNKYSSKHLTLYKCSSYNDFIGWDGLAYSNKYYIAVMVKLINFITRVFNKIYGKLLRKFVKWPVDYRDLDIDDGYISFWYFKQNVLIRKLLLEVKKRIAIYLKRI